MGEGADLCGSSRIGAEKRSKTPLLSLTLDSEKKKYNQSVGGIREDAKADALQSGRTSDIGTFGIEGY